MAEGGNGGKRALVVANEAVAGEELRERLIRELSDGTSKVYVVAPALAGSALKHYMGDVDDAIEPAGERLRRTIEELRDAGIDAEGEVGDSDPMVAIGDEIQKFHPDQVLVVAHRDGDGAFAEQGLLEQLERDLDLPVTELVVERERSEPHLLDVERTEAGAVIAEQSGSGSRRGCQWPRVRARARTVR
jgi:GABA permease